MDQPESALASLNRPRPIWTSMDQLFMYIEYSRSNIWDILALRGITPKLVYLISGLHSGTERAVNRDGTISNYFPVNTGLRQGCILAPTRLQHLYRPCTGRMLRNSGCGMSFGIVRFTYLDFADNAVIFVDTKEKIYWRH